MQYRRAEAAARAARLPCRAGSTPAAFVAQPNTLVSVTSPMLWLSSAVEMLIVGCTWTLNENGTLTELAIARPEAFELLSGVGQSKLSKKLKTKEQRDKREKARVGQPGCDGHANIDRAHAGPGIPSPAPDDRPRHCHGDRR